MSSIEALDLLLELGELLNADFERSMKDVGLNRTQTHAVWVLGISGGRLQQRAMADALGVTPRSVTEVLDVLSERGLVSRTPHPTDRRAVMVALSREGGRLFERLQRGQREFADLLFADMAASRRSAFIASLRHVIAKIRSAQQ
jgi:DNA-binding MarR family transcriptional regulator